jgi:hypothetical protein
VTETESRKPLLLAAGILILAHILLGSRLAPDALTSGAMLLVNLLVLYVGFNVYQHLPRIHFTLFVLSYIALFFICLVLMTNAESLFLL